MQKRTLATLAILSLMLCSMGCSFRGAAEDAARAAIAEALPAIKEAGKELADHASAKLAEAGGKLLTQAKDDIPGALKAAIPELKNASAEAVTATLKDRIALEDPVKAAKFEKTVEEKGLPEGVKELGGGSLALGILYLLRLYWRTKADANAKGEAVAAMASAVELHAAAPVKNAIAAFTKNRPAVDKVIHDSIPAMPRGSAAVKT